MVAVSIGSESSREAHVTRVVINVSRLRPPCCKQVADRQTLRVLAFRALGSVGQCPLLQEKERAKETEREKERDRDREGSCHSTDLSAQQSPIMGQSFLTSVQHDGVLLQH